MVLSFITLMPESGTGKEQFEKKEFLNHKERK
jgi:hypothetical protein